MLRSLFDRHLPLPKGPLGGFPGVPSGSVSALQNALASKCSELAGAESLRRSGASSALSSCPAGSLSRLHPGGTGLSILGQKHDASQSEERHVMMS